TDTHAGVGTQATMEGSGSDPVGLRDAMIALADTGGVGLVAKGRVDGAPRGYQYLAAGVFESDRAGVTTTAALLDGIAGPGSEITYTLVPAGAQTRIGVDRDGDTFYDGDEIDACTDPADATSFPGDGQPSLCACDGDIDGDGEVGFDDLLGVLAAWGPCGACDEDLDGDGEVGFQDLLIVLSAWGPCD
ncbi:MAG: hypothetical protein ACYTGP_13220, partial [Planctomycetota bacterium]